MKRWVNRHPHLPAAISCWLVAYLLCHAAVGTSTTAGKWMLLACAFGWMVAARRWYERTGGDA